MWKDSALCPHRESHCLLRGRLGLGDEPLKLHQLLDAVVHSRHSCVRLDHIALGLGELAGDDCVAAVVKAVVELAHQLLQVAVLLHHVSLRGQGAQHSSGSVTSMSSAYLLPRKQSEREQGSDWQVQAKSLNLHSTQQAVTQLGSDTARLDHYWTNAR